MKIAIDMDGVLCDFVGSAIARSKELWGIEMTEDSIASHSFADAVQACGVELSKAEIYGQVMGPGLFLNLEPFPDAVETLKNLAEEGHDITILTKALVIDRDSLGKRIASDHAVSEKLDWLAEHLGDMPYSVIMVSRMTDKHLVNTHVLVEDDPRALEHPSAITICVARPWNKQYRNDLKGMQTTIEGLAELPERIEFIENLLRTRDSLEDGLFEQMEEEVGINESTALRPGSCDSSD